MCPAAQGTSLKVKWSAPPAPVMVSAPYPAIRVSLPAPPTRFEPLPEPVSVWPPVLGGGGGEVGGGGDTGGGLTGGGETGGGEVGGGGGLVVPPEPESCAQV